MKTISTLLLSVLFATVANAADKRIDSADIDSLGGNEGVIRMAKALDPQNRARIVQKRTVDRNMRFELGLGYGGVLTGDPYVRTQNLGLSLDFHITPRWSVGAHYVDHSNGLTAEGDRVFNEARNANSIGQVNYVFPDIDPALRSAYAALNWYPIYGKTNLLDTSIAQFDLYLTAGLGQVQLSKNGWTTMSTAGLGVGVWLNKSWAVRGEFRGQNYTDDINGQARSLTSAVASVGLGYML